MNALLALAGVLAVVAVATAIGVALRRAPAHRTTPVDAAALEEAGLAADGRPVVVQFSTEYCARCPGVSRALSASLEGQDVRFAHIDITHRPETAKRLHILQTPSVFVVRPDGAVHSRLSGAVTAAAVQAELNTLRGDHVIVT